MRDKAGEIGLPECFHVVTMDLTSVNEMHFYRSINARKKALETEKERAARVASLPLPPPNPIQVSFKPHHKGMTHAVSSVWLCLIYKWHN